MSLQHPRSGRAEHRTDDSAPHRQFGLRGTGAIYTRTGRVFFNDPDLQTAMLDRVRTAITSSDLWSELATDWAVLDCELEALERAISGDTAAFLVELDDVTVEMVDAEHASVTLTVVIRRRTIGTDEESIDAREFAADVTRTFGPWQMKRVVAVDTLR